MKDEPKSQLVRTDRTKVRRMPQRSVYESAEIYRILDEALICRAGFTIGGQTFVVPTGCAKRR